MGCGSSANTAVVQPLPQQEEETGSKLGSRGDSAVSKGTTDSGVVMENKEIPLLPGAVPRKLPPLPSQCVRETSPGLHTVQERQKSCEILEELLNQGIIPEGQARQRSNGAGEAYSIMLDDKDVRRRPPARLESLKAKNMRSLPSKEEIDEKIRLVEERRKLREDELKMRLRTKSARVRVRAPISSTEEDEDTSLTPVNPLQSPLTHDPAPALLFHSQTAAKGGKCISEAEGDVRESEKKMDKEETRKGSAKGKESGDRRGGNAEWLSDGDGDEAKEEEELNQVEELQAGQLLTASGELESDSSFQHTEDKEETF
ncbi:stathmin domain-containing protein 1 isoform X2 [Trachinotus anak]|uniref:stathmin domain-containing protein 1 isoform X2 n=1 Tax=Trachinotus anak TaxID=443729 RepID=UPI0039F25F5C